MSKYLFFLGRQPQIAQVELASVFKVPVKMITKDVAMLKLTESPENKQNFLGGVIKIAEVLSIEEEIEIDQSIIEHLNNNDSTKNKKTFALNLYGQKEIEIFLKKHLLAIKKMANFSLRFCNNNFKNIISVVTYKEILAKNNIEFNLVKLEQNNFLFTHTIACQNPDAYSERDYEKPYRDAKNGMLPPKLAQILINIAGDEVQSIWDPFCGTGTILQEAVLLGKKKLIGSDISIDMVKASQKNLAWLRLYAQKFGLNYHQNYEIFEHNATKFINKLVDAVITEGFLGEVKRMNPTEIELMKTDNLLTELYDNFFKQLAKNRIKTVIICLPVYKMNKKLGFMKKTLASIIQNKYNAVVLSESERKTLIYSREDQFVYREICKFQLQND